MAVPGSVCVPLNSRSPEGLRWARRDEREREGQGLAASREAARGPALRLLVLALEGPEAQELVRGRVSAGMGTAAAALGAGEWQADPGQVPELAPCSAGTTPLTGMPVCAYWERLAVDGRKGEAARLPDFAEAGVVGMGVGVEEEEGAVSEAGPIGVGVMVGNQ